MSRRQPARISGQLLAWARDTIGLDVETAANRIGVRTEHLGKCEAGQETLSITQLREASRVYKRPLAAFFLPEPPRGFSVPHDFRRAGDKPLIPLSPEALVAIRTAHYRRELAEELADKAEASSRQLLGTLSLPAPVEQTAEIIRQQLGVDLEQQKCWRDKYKAINGWKDAIERQGVLVFHFSGVDVEEIRAFSISVPPFPVISVNASDSPYGRIFSLLHEFGHLLLNEGGTCDLRTVEPVRSADHNQQVEVFCNALAGSTLVPEEDLERQELVRRASPRTQWSENDLILLASTYQVSTQVILRRLLTIGSINRQFYERKQDELAEQAKSAAEREEGFLEWPRKVVRSVGQPFARIVLGAYYREDITSSDVAEYLGTRLKHLAAIEHLLSGKNTLTGGDR